MVNKTIKITKGQILAIFIAVILVMINNLYAYFKSSLGSSGIFNIIVISSFETIAIMFIAILIFTKISKGIFKNILISLVVTIVFVGFSLVNFINISQLITIGIFRFLVTLISLIAGGFLMKT